MANLSIFRRTNNFPSKEASGRVSAGTDLRKITTPILIHLLAEDMLFPKVFLIRCKLTVNHGGPIIGSPTAKRNATSSGMSLINAHRA